MCLGQNIRSDSHQNHPHILHCPPHHLRGRRRWYYTTYLQGIQLVETEHPHFQVHLSDRNEDEFEAEEPPTELFLDMSVQENLLENARIGITTLHQCDFQIEDTDNVTEDNVFVTGFTVE